MRRISKSISIRSLCGRLFTCLPQCQNIVATYIFLDYSLDVRLLKSYEKLMRYSVSLLFYCRTIVYYQYPKGILACRGGMLGLVFFILLFFVGGLVFPTLLFYMASPCAFLSCSACTSSLFSCLRFSSFSVSAVLYTVQFTLATSSFI